MKIVKSFVEVFSDENGSSNWMRIPREEEELITIGGPFDGKVPFEKNVKILNYIRTLYN